MLCSKMGSPTPVRNRLLLLEVKDRSMADEEDSVNVLVPLLVVQVQNIDRDYLFWTKCLV